MSLKYEILDDLIKDEIREFILWLEEEKHLRVCRREIADFYPIHGVIEDLINEYMRTK